MPVPPDILEYTLCHYVWPGTTPSQLAKQDEDTLLRHWMIWQQDQIQQGMKAGQWNRKRETGGGKHDKSRT